jgi:selenocysteine lyase/cysteine desulfurase
MMPDPNSFSNFTPERWSDAWSLRPGVAFLNHGSFGLVPRSVQVARQKWQQRLYAEPVDFLVRQMEAELSLVARRVGSLIGAPGQDLVFVDNATVAMNIVAQSIALNTGDEVLMTDHEYGAVRRIWQKRCDRAGARLVVQAAGLPCGFGRSLVRCCHSENKADCFQPNDLSNRRHFAGERNLPAGS